MRVPAPPLPARPTRRARAGCLNVGMEAIETRIPDVAQDVAEEEEDLGADLSDDELGDLLVREVTIDGMCGVY